MKLSKKQKINEITKCIKDPVYFINNYVKIQHPIKGWIPFRLYPFQSELIKIFKNERLTCINKARQMGLTTLMSAYCAWLINFHKAKKIAIIATKKETAAYLIGKIQDAYGDLPEWMKLSEVVNSNVHTFKLSNKSSAKALSKAKDASRGIDASLVIFDEAAHVEEDMEKFWGSLKATVSEGGSIIISSTPNGAGDWFCNMFEGAREGTNGF
ncbi:terminase family protein, partial [Candidatus Woesearchaeota archaeon]|nr:terminase family protein [Candidatus Woesearchaeota archaeon]